MTTQVDLFERAGVAIVEPEPTTKVQLGKRERNVKLSQRRREALQEFMEVLADLEGKDIFIGHYGGNARSYYWVDDLKLGHMKIERSGCTDRDDPGVIVLRGSRSAAVRIFTDRVYALRRQEYRGYTLWLLDFWNGFGEYPIDRYHRPGYDSLKIKRFND